MKLKSLTIPEDSGLLSAWIEDQLMSFDLGDTVAEMRILSDSSNDANYVSLQEVLGNDSNAVLSQGLTVLSEDQLLQLVGHPYLLIELQDLVLLNGGDYWQALASQPEPPQASAVTWQQVLQNRTDQPTVEREPELPSSGSPWWKAGLSLAIAASILVVAVMFIPPKPPTGWGFNNPAVLTAKHSEDEMLGVLADAAHAWFNKVPQDAEALALRLKQFDAGCEKLLKADLPQLSEETREEVRRVCRTTRERLQAHLESIESDEDFTAIKKSADETAVYLEEGLRALR